MPDDYKNNPVIFPPADLVAKCEYPQYAGTEITRLLDESMTRLRAD
jgi:spermidine/putrescine transport system substrate-binding protein